MMDPWHLEQAVRSSGAIDPGMNTFAWQCGQVTIFKAFWAEDIGWRVNVAAAISRTSIGCTRLCSAPLIGTVAGP